MNFDYLFLLVGSEAFLETAKAQVESFYPKAQYQCSTDPQEAAEFCQANVYDLIIVQAAAGGIGPQEMINQIRDLQNDNHDTGALVCGLTREKFENPKFTMFVPEDMPSEEFGAKSRTLLSLKS